jgi:hypothetical protein
LKNTRIRVNKHRLLKKELKSSINVCFNQSSLTKKNDNNKRILEISTCDSPAPLSKRIKKDTDYYNKQKRETETTEQLYKRLEEARDIVTHLTLEQKSAKKVINKIHQVNSRKNKSTNKLIEIENFKKSILDLIDQVCAVCHRKF